MNNDLFLAILAMDSYNRGYDAGIANLPVGGHIGNATILTDSTAKLGSGVTEAAGFYGIAYRLNGQPVISFRGTDDKIGDFVNAFLNGDILNGWPTIFGSIAGAQSDLAIEFFKSVAAAEGASSPRTAQIISTGHSLGGALAGYVSGLYQRQAVIFDNIPFEDAAEQAYALLPLAATPSSASSV